MQGATAVERLTIYLSIGWFVRMLREESEISAWHGLIYKAYDPVDHGWLSEMFTLHRFPILFAKVMEKLANNWNTRIVAQSERPKAKRCRVQYVLRKDCLKVMRSVLCCSYCG